MSDSSKTSTIRSTIAAAGRCLKIYVFCKPLEYYFNLKYAGHILGLFSVFSLRFLFYPWLWRGSGNDVYLPVISPVYRQAEHWQYWLQSAAILLHVFFGALMLFIATIQFDKNIRHGYPHIHRWCGRLYVVAGIICISSLRFLRDTAGAGSSPSGNNRPLIIFIDVSSVLWLLTTAIGVTAAICKNYSLHRDAMAFSVGIASVPVAQRSLSWAFLTTGARIARVLFCASPQRIPWHTTWGPPGDSSSLLWGDCDSCAIAQSADPRACPLVLSLDGYGEGEQASLAASAWITLIAICIWATPRLLAHITKYSTNSLADSLALAAAHSDNNSKNFSMVGLTDAELLGNLTFADLWRTEGRRLGQLLRWLSLTRLCPAISRDVQESKEARKYFHAVLMCTSSAVSVVVAAVILWCGVAVVGLLISLATHISGIMIVLCVAVVVYLSHALYYTTTVPPSTESLSS